MNELGLAQKFSIVALNAQASRSMTNAKKVALRCISVATVIETYLITGLIQAPDELTMKKEMLNHKDITLYQKILFGMILSRRDTVTGTLSWWITRSSKVTSRQLKKLEKAITESLMGVDMIEEIPNLLGCDLYYDTSGVTIKEYRSNVEEYTRITETIRAEILEEGSVSDETISMLWLLRESGCLHDIFSNKELDTVSIRINELYRSISFAKTMFSLNVHRGMEIAIKNFLKMKKQAIMTPTGTGINFIFPVIERSQSIFIDTQAWFSNSQQRLNDVKERLESNGHTYTVLREGQAPLIKIDNIIYEAIPEAIYGKVPIHGVRLRKYPI
ncbi:MAG: hypothetical protein WAX04_13615 [Oscillospiraceae bacterium]